MKYFVILDELAFSRLPVLSAEKMCLVIDDVLTVPEIISNKFEIYHISKLPESLEIQSCESYTKSYERHGDIDLYEECVEPHINGIYEYVVSKVNSIIYTLDVLIDVNDQVVLIGGNKNFKIASYYGVKSPEFNRNTFINRGEILNPLLFDALSVKCSVNYVEDPLISVAVKYFFRINLLYFFSYFLSLFKFISGCIKSNDKNGFDKLKNKRCVIFPVRSNPQFDYVDSVAKSISEAESDIHAVVVYSEMLLGKSFFSRIVNPLYSVISLFKVKYIYLFLLLPFEMLLQSIKSYYDLKKYSPVIVNFSDFSYSLSLRFLSFENMAFPHVYLYRKLLGRAVQEIVKKKCFYNVTMCSTEMIGIQAFLERSIGVAYLHKFSNIQTAAISGNYYPIKVVGDNTFCISESDSNNFNTHGIDNKGVARYIGALKYLGGSNQNVGNGVLKTILFATQPYESQLTFQFLEELSYWIKSNSLDVKLRIRIHPRDDIRFYDLLSGVEFVSDTETVVQSVLTSSLVLTRTSSVVLDAIALKVPFVVCKLSNFDRNMDVNYLNYTNLSVSCVEELIDKLQDLPLLRSLYEHSVLNQVKNLGAAIKDDQIISSLFEYL